MSIDAPAHIRAYSRILPENRVKLTVANIAKLAGVITAIGGAIGTTYTAFSSIKVNRDKGDWTIKHQADIDRLQGWIVDQLDPVSQGKRPDWQHYPRPTQP